MYLSQINAFIINGTHLLDIEENPHIKAQETLEFKITESKQDFSFTNP